MSEVGAATLLLDTCALIWLANGEPMEPRAIASLERAAAAGGVLVSPASAWEVGLLSRKADNAPMFRPDPRSWFAAALGAPGIRSAPLTWSMALQSSHLPSGFHGDPADRLLVATARELAVQIVTRDAAMLAYARAGHVDALVC